MKKLVLAILLASIAPICARISWKMPSPTEILRNKEMLQEILAEQNNIEQRLQQEDFASMRNSLIRAENDLGSIEDRVETEQISEDEKQQFLASLEQSKTPVENYIEQLARLLDEYREFGEQMSEYLSFIIQMDEPLPRVQEIRELHDQVNRNVRVLSRKIALSQRTVEFLHDMARDILQSITQLQQDLQ